MEEVVTTKLARISQLSRENQYNPEFRFLSLAHIIDKELLMQCHAKMDGRKTVGIDGISKEEYEVNLSENLEDLLSRMKRNAYKPKPARRVEIPKDNGKTRPLSIYCYEDKLVQEALREILEAVFEPLFYDAMMGFRPKRGCHQALRKLNKMLEWNYTNYVLDADIKGFFDHLDHDWIIKFVGSKIKDPQILRLIKRMLKSGIMKDYQFEPTEEGSGQGSVCSPVLANIYMHYVLVWWFEKKIKPQLKGYAGIVVYADDFVVCFQRKSDAEWFYERLKGRMEYFGLSLEEEKSRLIEFGRFAEGNRERRHQGKPESFNFLGFTHYCSKSRYGKFRVKRKTSKKKYKKKSREIRMQIKNMRTRPFKEAIGKLNQILTGYFHYYGITDNMPGLKRFRDMVQKSLFFWFNRRSQKKSFTWNRFNLLLTLNPLVKPKIYVSIYG